MRTSLQYRITAVAFLGALVLGYFGRDVVRPVNQNTTVTVPITNSVTANVNAELNVNNDVEYSSHQACYSDFPIGGVNTEENLDPATLQSLISKATKNQSTGNAFSLPVEFMQEMQKKFDAGWSLYTFCVDASNSIKPEIYFSLVNILDTTLKPALTAPKGSVKYSPSVIGYWKGGSEVFQPIEYSSIVGIHGMGDLSSFGTLNLQHSLTTEIGGTDVIRGLTGGGDGPFGWSMEIEFSPSAKTTKVVRYCTYDSSGEKQVNQCGTSIK